jgi:hypothetical protein
VDLQADSFAVNVSELHKRVLGDINGMLKDRSAQPFFQPEAEGTYVVGLAGGNVYHSGGVGVGEDVGGNSLCWVRG